MFSRLILPILRFALENPMLLGLLNGYKTLIGRVVVIVGGLITLAPYVGFQIPFAEDVNASLLLLAGWAGVELGLMHKNDKSSRGL